MFLIKLDGQAAAVTNTFDSAASYVDRIRQPGHRITIVAMQPEDWSDALRTLEGRAGAGALSHGASPARLSRHMGPTDLSAH